MTDFDRWWATFPHPTDPAIYENERVTALGAWIAARAQATEKAGNAAKRYNCKKMRGLCLALAAEINRDEK